MANDRRVSMTPIARAFGLVATVTRPQTNPIATTVIWLEDIFEDAPAGRDHNRLEPRRLMGILRSEVPTVPRGTKIEVAESKGGPSRTFQIDAVESADVDEFKVIVIPETL